MQVKKVIKCKVVGLTKSKRTALQREYNNLQIYLQTFEDLGVYSANKQQADRFYKKIVFGRAYPISIRNDLLQIEKRNTKISNYWTRIRVKSSKNLWVAVTPHIDFPEDYKICESKLFQKGNDWYLYITIQKDIPHIQTTNVLGIDLGSKWVATVCDLQSGKTKYYGRNVRETRGKYFYLKRTVTKKNFENIEQRKVNDQLHKISRNIVDWAKQSNSTIIIGDLKGIKRDTEKGRKFNRKVNTMPSFQLKQRIKYKADWLGIPVVFVNEAYTSKTCSKCGIKGTRKAGLFKCICGYQDNSDRNGAINIAKRGLGQASSSGVVSDQPRTVESGLTEATSFKRW